MAAKKLGVEKEEEMKRKGETEEKKKLRVFADEGKGESGEK